MEASIPRRLGFEGAFKGFFQALWRPGFWAPMCPILRPRRGSTRASLQPQLSGGLQPAKAFKQVVCFLFSRFRLKVCHVRVCPRVLLTRSGHSQYPSLGLGFTFFLKHLCLLVLTKSERSFPCCQFVCLSVFLSFPRSLLSIAPSSSAKFLSFLVTF